MADIKLSEELQKQLGLYAQTITESVKEVTEQSMKRLVKESKLKAPKGKRKKHYKSKISSKTTYESPTGRIKTWYVKAPDYRLTHLIVHGHATRNGGRTQANDFLSPIVEDVEKEYIEKIEEVIKNG